MYVHDKILCCLNIAIQEFPRKKKGIFKQNAAPTLATLAGAANGLRPLAARGLTGKRLCRVSAATSSYKSSIDIAVIAENSLEYSTQLAW